MIGTAGLADKKTDAAWRTNRMNEKGTIFFSYIKYHRKSLALFSCFILLNWIIGYLYHTPTEMTLYWTVLCLILGILCMTVDFLRKRRNHFILENVKKNVHLNLEHLPRPETIAEKDYQNFLDILREDLSDFHTAAGKNRQEMTDYYTLWVHQIKTPIAAMRLILQEEDNEINRELSIQLFSVEQYVELVLQYIRLESISTDYDFKMQELDEIVRQALRKYAPLFIRKRLILRYEPLNCRVLTDEKWICFVLEQILSNALKYTENGSISIYMKTDSDKILVIEDTGIGIAAEDLPRICEKNFTGYNGRRDKKASGLGLYLSRKILKKLGHGLKIESEPGVGTRVMISLNTAHINYE